MKKENTEARNTDAMLTPPWYTLRNQVAAVLTSPHVNVGQLDASTSPYVLPITANDRNIAIAVASILPKEYPIGNITVVARVMFGKELVTPVVPKSADELAGLVKAAFRGNPLLVEVIPRLFTPITGMVVFAIFQAQVVQFFNDDLSDYYQNYNGVLAVSARATMAPAPGGIGLFPSTAQITVPTTEEGRKSAKVQV